MGPSNRVDPYSLTILGKQTLAAMKKEGATLSRSFKRNAWKVKQKSSWQGRQISAHKIRKQLSRAFKILRPPGKQLFEAYVSHLQTTGVPLLAPQSTPNALPQALRFKTASAFVLAGVCEIKKGAGADQVRSTGKVIDQRVIERLDHLASCSPIRLAYEFLARNKRLPKGYLSEVIHPALIAMLTDKGIALEEATLFVDDQLRKFSIVNEKHISLENMLEVKNRIRYFLSGLSDTNSVSVPEKIKRTDAHGSAPSLDAPSVKPGYVCDDDDLWLIQETVKNSRTMRLAGDLTKRICRWAERNKRTTLLAVSEFALEVLLSGLFTGGIGAAVTSLAFVSKRVSLFIWDKSMLEIRSSRAKTFLKKWQQLPERKQTFDDFLESCAYLTSQKGVTKILNAYENLEASVKQLEKQHENAQLSSGQQVKYQKKKALMQLRYQQLRKCFGETGSDDQGDVGSYDQLMVEAVQEISRLDSEFEQQFSELWKPFEKMSASERWDIFNEAANQRSVKRHWYELSRNQYQWINRLFKQGGTSINEKLKAAFEKVPMDDKNNKFEFSRLYNWNMHTIKDTAMMIGNGLVSYLREMTKYAIGSTLKLPQLIRAGEFISVRHFIPKHWGPFVVVWAFCYFGGKITERINRSMNKARVKKMHKAALQQRFDQQEKLSKNEWHAMRREAKDTMHDFVDTLKELRGEHRKINQMLDKKKVNTLSESERNMLFATVLLRRKMLEQRLNGLLTGAIGHMHEETVRAAWQQQQTLKTLEVV